MNQTWGQAANSSFSKNPAVHRFTHVFDAIFIQFQWLLHLKKGHLRQIPHGQGEVYNAHSLIHRLFFRANLSMPPWYNPFPRNTPMYYLTPKSKSMFKNLISSKEAQRDPRKKKHVLSWFFLLSALFPGEFIHFSSQLKVRCLPTPLPKSVTGSPPSCYWTTGLRVHKESPNEPQMCDDHGNFQVDLKYLKNGDSWGIGILNWGTTSWSCSSRRSSGNIVPILFKTKKQTRTPVSRILLPQLPAIQRYKFISWSQGGQLSSKWSWRLVARIQVPCTICKRHVSSYLGGHTALQSE